MGRPLKKDELNPRQRLFVKNYVKNTLENGSGTGIQGKTAIDSGYSPNTAYASASRMLKDVKIINAVKKSMDEIVNKLEIGAEWQLETLKRLQQKTEVDEKYDASIRAVSTISTITGTVAPTKNLNVNANVEINDGNIDDLINLYKRDF